MNERIIKTGEVAMEPFDEADVGDSAVAWLTAQMQETMLLLAHADDGIIWGLGKNGAFHLPPTDLYPQAQLRDATLQMARLFNAKEEIFLWRTGENQWRARQLIDGSRDPCRYFDEEQVLWGTKVEMTRVTDEVSSEGFSLVAEGVQGLRHTVPLLLAEENWDNDHPLRIGVRHYLAADSDGCLRVAMSRLTGVWKEVTK